MNYLQFEQWVPFPIERVFAFFSNPENLPRLMPPQSDTRILAIKRVHPQDSPEVMSGKAAGIGSTIITSFRVFSFLPLRKQWTARITEFEWNCYFADVQEEGPFQAWHHRHEFHCAERNGVGGTLVRDIIDYEIGFGFLGSIANALFVRREMQRTFAERQKKLPELLR